MNRVLAALRSEQARMNPQQFALMAEGPLDEIRRLESQIAAWSGRAEFEDAEADVWLGIEGEDIAWPDAPSSVVASLLSSLRKGVQAAAEWMLRGDLSTRPTSSLKAACDLRISVVRSGSVRLGLRLPTLDAKATATGDVAREALGKFLAAAEWVANPTLADSSHVPVADDGLRRVLLTELKRLAPRPRGAVRSVFLKGRGASLASVVLTREAHARIDSLIDASTRESSEAWIGDLREIDLDNRRFILRNLDLPTGMDRAPFEVPCQFEPELLETALAALDRRVQVRGTRAPGGSRGGAGRLLGIVSLVIIDDGAEPNLTSDG